MSKKIRSDQEWLELIQECRASGLSARNWCQTNSISIKTFYNKVADLRKKSCDTPGPQTVLSGQKHEVVPWKWLLIRYFIRKIPPMAPCRSLLPMLLSRFGYPDTVLKFQKAFQKISSAIRF